MGACSWPSGIFGKVNFSCLLPIRALSTIVNGWLWMLCSLYRMLTLKDLEVDDFSSSTGTSAGDWLAMGVYLGWA